MPPMWSGSFSHRIQNAKVRSATALTPNQGLEQTRDSVLRCGELVGRELLNFFVRCGERLHKQMKYLGRR
jgi:hypothetical protein